MKTAAIIDYGSGNIHSVQKALQHVSPCETKIIVTSLASDILEADHLILPGVGSIGDCMQALHKSHLIATIRDTVFNKPTLGICVGMQILLQKSEENGGVEGLNFFQAKACKFPRVTSNNPSHIKIPHMGWNQVHQKTEHPLWNGIPQQSYFYFAHSYFTKLTYSIDTAATCHHGTSFPCALNKGTLFGVQFHPEKSSTNGLKLLKNFLSWNPPI